MQTKAGTRRRLAEGPAAADRYASGRRIRIQSAPARKGLGMEDTINATALLTTLMSRAGEEDPG